MHQPLQVVVGIDRDSEPVLVEVVDRPVLLRLSRKEFDHYDKVDSDVPDRNSSRNNYWTRHVAKQRPQRNASQAQND